MSLKVNWSVGMNDSFNSDIAYVLRRNLMH